MNALAGPVCLFAALFTAAPPTAPAEKGVAPEPLMTRKGKLIFSDDFAAGIDPKWVRPYGNWSIAEGALKGAQRQADGHNANCKMAFDFADAVVQFDLMFDGAGLANFAVDSARGHVGRFTLAPHGFSVQKDGSGTDPADPRKILDTTACEFKPKRWYPMTVEFRGGEVLARVDDRHFVVGSDPKFERAKTRITFGVHGEFLRIDNVKVFAATPDPDWPAAKLRARHAPAPVPPVVGPDHYKNAQAKKKAKDKK